MASILEIRLLGPFDVRVNDVSMPRLRSRKGQWLLALLVLRTGREVQRDWLAGTLWPDSEERDALYSLRRSLSDLRIALGTEAVRLRSPKPRTLSIDLTGAVVDVISFDESVARGGEADLEKAVSLYRGPLLEGCFEEWALPEQRAREQAFLAALETLADRALARSDYMAATAYLQRVIDADRLRESAYRSLMSAFAANGDYSAAIDVYRNLRVVLRDQLNCDPDAETQSLFRRLRDEARAGGSSVEARGNTPSPPRPMPRSAPLPVPLTELIGREEEVRELRARLDSSRLVTMMGTGGIGKTRLALRMAAELQDHFEDGSSFVDLTAISDAAILPEVVQQALGLTQNANGRDDEEVLKEYLAPRHILLVLDNCERLVAGCATLADRLLGRCPRLKVLATSRHALGVRGETLYRVPSLALPPAAPERIVGQSPIPTSDALRFPATKLFVERARASGALFDLTSGTADSVVAICRRLDGIPLAIELAAARVRSLSIGEVNERLSKDFGLLQGGETWGIERHRTLRTVFDWSWNLLSPEEQSALAALSSFAGSWTLEAAQAVLNTGERDIVDLLTSLVDKSLVVYMPSGEFGGVPLNANPAGRYRLLETVRQFADERLGLTEARLREAVMRRHRDFYLAWAEEARESLRGSNSAYWFGRFEAEHDNLRAAIAWCRHQDDIEEEFRLLIALARFWDTHGHLSEGRTYLESAMSRMTPAVPAALRGAVAGQAGWAALAQADYVASKSHYLQVLAICRADENHACVGDILNFLAGIAMHEGRLEEAQIMFEESLTLVRPASRPASLASVLNNFAELENLRGDLCAAEAHLTEAASICEAEGITQLLGIVHGNLSVTALRSGRFHDGEVHCMASIRALCEADALVNMADVLRQMGVVSVELGNPERAARLLGAADALAETLEVPLRDFGTAEVDRATAAVRIALGTEEFDVLYECGKALSLEQAIQYALNEDLRGS